MFWFPIEEKSINASVGPRSSTQQLRRWRIVPLGYTRAAVCVIDEVSADAPPAPQPVEVARFDWEFKSGRAGWEVLRKEARPPMVGASSRHR